MRLLAGTAARPAGPLEVAEETGGDIRLGRLLAADFRWGPRLLVSIIVGLSWIVGAGGGVAANAEQRPQRASVELGREEPGRAGLLLAGLFRVARREEAKLWPLFGRASLSQMSS